jgi:hypothetical protein
MPFRTTGEIFGAWLPYGDCEEFFAESIFLTLGEEFF